MKDLHIPRINARYWAAITLASVFGTNMGDLYAHDSGLGILGGLPVLAAIVALAYVLERRDNRKHEAWYWLAIIVIRTGATNIADYLCGRHYLGWNRFALSAGLAAMIAGLVWSVARSAATQSGLPQTNARYWAAMLAAGVLGTALGDALERVMGQAVGSGVLLAVLLVVLAFNRSAAALPVFSYWLIVCVARTAGTAIGDLLAENETLNLGLNVSTALSGLLFVAVLWLWRSRPQPGGASA